MVKRKVNDFEPFVGACYSYITEQARDKKKAELERKGYLVYNVDKEDTPFPHRVFVAGVQEGK